MSIVTRANKAGSGTPNYAPNTTILSDEVNLDLNTIYDDYDGNITDANIATGANINGAKLADGTVTGAKLANLTVTTGKLADGAVTTAKIALDASTPSGAGANGTPSLTITDTEQTILTLAGMTTRGGWVLLTGSLPLMYQQARNVIVTAILRIKSNGSLVSQYNYDFVTANLAETALTTIPIPTPSLLFHPGAGTYVFTVTAQLSAAASGQIISPSSGNGTFAGVEFA